MFNAVFKSMTDQSKSNVHFNEGDYRVDGLLYCGKCHTAKQGRFEMPWGVVEPYFCCECEYAKRLAEEEAEKQKERRRRIERRRMNGFPDSEMMSWTFANDDGGNEKLTNALKRYVDHFADFKEQGKGLLLYGTVGTGKTYAACEVANALIDAGYSAYVTSISRVVNTVQGMFEGKQEYLDSLNKYSLLVLDDLGAERDTEYMQEMVFNIIDARYRIGKPMIVTSNMTIEQLKKPDGLTSQRIYDRVLERCFPIEVNGASRRRKIIREDYEEMKEMLGL